MAIYHLSARAPIARAEGRSATAAAAYRAGTAIWDERTGVRFDYRRRRGVLGASLQLPGGRTVVDRASFWNGIESHHRRLDSVLAREVVVALPAELNSDQRAELAFAFALDIANEFNVAVDCALHAPSEQGDGRNFHAHILLTACHVDACGTLGKKAVRLDPIACRRAGEPDSVSWLRPRWQILVNDALAAHGLADRVDHRSFKARGIAMHPTVHIGKKGTSAVTRARLNAGRRYLNSQAASLMAQLDKLARMRAWLRDRAGDKAAAHSIAGAPEIPPMNANAGMTDVQGDGTAGASSSPHRVPTDIRLRPPEQAKAGKMGREVAALPKRKP